MDAPRGNTGTPSAEPQAAETGGAFAFRARRRGGHALLRVLFLLLLLALLWAMCGCVVARDSAGHPSDDRDADRASGLSTKPFLTSIFF